MKSSQNHEPDKTGQHSTEAADDDELVQLALSGNRCAFEEITRRYNQRCFRIARSFLRQDADAMDVVQDAYVQAFSHLDQYKGNGRLSAWISQIVRNAALMRLRSINKVTVMMVDDLESAVGAQFERRLSTPETATESGQIGRLIEHCVELLPLDFREVFMLRGIEQMSVQETSRVIGISPETVKSRYHRARKLMQGHIQKRIDIAELDAFSFAGNRCLTITNQVMQKLVDLKLVQ